ncbi:hypothetical protein K4K56_012589 [Colletotrichum sp. SAR 10_98]|nr:hypothetical protein K4K56_012589 [Colletotrichum sp. SAR 10_98]
MSTGRDKRSAAMKQSWARRKAVSAQEARQDDDADELAGEQDDSPIEISSSPDEDDPEDEFDTDDEDVEFEDVLSPRRSRSASQYNLTESDIVQEHAQPAHGFGSVFYPYAQGQSAHQSAPVAHEAPAPEESAHESAQEPAQESAPAPVRAPKRTDAADRKRKQAALVPSEDEDEGDFQGKHSIKRLDPKHHLYDHNEGDPLEDWCMQGLTSNTRHPRVLFRSHRIDYCDFCEHAGHGPCKPVPEELRPYARRVRDATRRWANATSEKAIKSADTHRSTQIGVWKNALKQYRRNQGLASGSEGPTPRKKVRTEKVTGNQTPATTPKSALSKVTRPGESSGVGVSPSPAPRPLASSPSRPAASAPSRSFLSGGSAQRPATSVQRPGMSAPGPIPFSLPAGTPGSRVAPEGQLFPPTESAPRRSPRNRGLRSKQCSQEEKDAQEDEENELNEAIAQSRNESSARPNPYAPPASGQPASAPPVETPAPDVVSTRYPSFSPGTPNYRSGRLDEVLKRCPFNYTPADMYENSREIARREQEEALKEAKAKEEAARKRQAESAPQRLGSGTPYDEESTDTVLMVPSALGSVPVARLYDSQGNSHVVPRTQAATAASTPVGLEHTHERPLRRGLVRESVTITYDARAWRARERANRDLTALMRRTFSGPDQEEELAEVLDLLDIVYNGP